MVALVLRCPCVFIGGLDTGNAIAGIAGNAFDLHQSGVAVFSVDIEQRDGGISIVDLEHFNGRAIHVLARLGINEDLIAHKAVDCFTLGECEISVEHHDIAPVIEHAMKKINIIDVIVSLVRHHLFTILELVYLLETAPTTRL